MKNKWKIILTAIVTVGVAVVSTSTAVAWFDSRITAGPGDNVTGRTNGAYFAYGDGSQNNPFGINAPRHLYNLAWLQYLGYFNNNTIGPDSGPVYFELDPAMKGSLDMASIVIPPIGTSTFPFVGYFDGNNKTITNLNVDNVVGEGHIEKKPSVVRDIALSGTTTKVLKESTGGANYSDTKTVSIMGMFGKTDTISENDNTPHIFDFKLDNATISSSSNSLVVGAAVGYLDSKMSNVAVSSPEINITNSPSVYTGLTNLSDYTLVGYATSDYISEGHKKVVTADKPQVEHDTTQGAGSDFGASIPMKDIYERLLTKHNAAEPFVYNEIWDGEIGEGTLTKEPIYSTINGRDSGRYSLDGIKEKDSGGNEIASYTFAKRPGTNAYMYLYGKESGSYTKNIEGIAYDDAISAKTEFLIGDGEGHWLTYAGANRTSYNDGTYAVTSTTDPDSAQKWIYEDGAIRSSNYTGSHRPESGWWGGDIYHYGYLSLINDALSIKVESSDLTHTGWSFDNRTVTTSENVENEDGTITVVTDSTAYRVLSANASGVSTAYVMYDNGWKVGLEDDNYRILAVGEGFTNYLHIDSINPIRVSQTTNALEATRWYDSDSGGYRFKYGDVWYIIVTTVKKAKLYSGGTAADVQSYAVDKQLSIVPESTYNAELMRPYLFQTNNGNNYLGNEFDLVTSAEEYRFIVVIWREAVTTSYRFDLKVNGNTLTAVTSFDSATPIQTVGKDITLYDLKFQTGSKTEETDWESYPTYFPLSYDTSVTTDVSSKNTGYVVSGSNFTYGNGNFPGDIRVSNYNNTANNNLSASLGGGNSYNNMTIITHEPGELGHYVAVKDDYNSSLANVPNALSGVASTFKTPEQLGFIRYDESREDMHDQFTADFSQIHGLHFMDSEISTSHITTVPNAHILGQTYTNYEMPEDCIDFNLKTKGYITFYAGTYFPGNTTFFSLHEIIRNADKTINTINEITQIYDNNGENRRNKRYIYEYSSGNNNLGQGDARGDLLFDMSWVTNPSWVNNAVYYFEIPVMKGEYALGSVSGKDGAYLMYLDIGSARPNNDITTVTERILTENFTSTYVDGIDFASTTSTSSVAGGSSANVTIPSGSTGSYSFSFENSTLSCSGGNNTTATHVGEGVTLSNITNGMITGDRIQEDIVTEVVYNDFDETITTTTTKTTTTNGGTPVEGDPVTDVEYNVLAEEYDTEILVQDETGTIVKFRYWGNVTFTTDVDFREGTYTFEFNTSDPLTIYVEELSPGNSGYSVKFKGNGQNAQVVPVTQQGQYYTINPSS